MANDRPGPLPIALTIAVLAWLVALAFLPSTPVPGIEGYYNGKRLIGVIVLAMAAIGLAAARPGSVLFSRAAVIGLALFFALGLISALRAEVLSYALAEVVVAGLLLVAIGFHARVTGTRPDWIERGLIPTLTAAVVLYGLMALVLVFGDMFGGYSHQWPERIYNFANRRFLNQWQSWVLPFLPVALLIAVPRVRPGLSRSAIFVFFGLGWAMLFYSLGRAALYAQLAVMALMPLLLGRRALGWSLLQLAAGVAGVVLAALVLDFNLLDRVLDAPAERLLSLESSGRRLLWGVAGQMALESPWLGLGPMQYAALETHVAAHPHNFPLQVIAEWGLPAALCLGAVLALALWRWTGFARRRIAAADCDLRERWLLISLTGSAFAAGGHSLASGVVVMPLSQLMLATIAGAMLGIYRRHCPAENPWRGPDGLRHAGAVAMAAVAVTLGAWSFQQIAWQQQLRAAGDDLMLSHNKPRYWQQGVLFHFLDGPPREFHRGRELPPLEATDNADVAGD